MCAVYKCKALRTVILPLAVAISQHVRSTKVCEGQSDVFK